MGVGDKTELLDSSHRKRRWFKQRIIYFNLFTNGPKTLGLSVHARLA